MLLQEASCLQPTAQPANRWPLTAAGPHDDVGVGAAELTRLPPEAAGGRGRRGAAAGVVLGRGAAPRRSAEARDGACRRRRSHAAPLSCCCTALAPPDAPKDGAGTCGSAHKWVWGFGDVGQGTARRTCTQANMLQFRRTATRCQPGQYLPRPAARGSHGLPAAGAALPCTRTHGQFLSMTCMRQGRPHRSCEHRQRSRQPTLMLQPLIGPALTSSWHPTPQPPHHHQNHILCEIGQRREQSQTTAQMPALEHRTPPLCTLSRTNLELTHTSHLNTQAPQGATILQLLPAAAQQPLHVGRRDDGAARLHTGRAGSRMPSSYDWPC